MVKMEEAEWSWESVEDMVAAKAPAITSPTRMGEAYWVSIIGTTWSARSSPGIYTTPAKAIIIMGT